MQRKTDLFYDAIPIGWAGLFGLGTEAGGYWPKVRAAQRARLGRTAPLRLVLHLLVPAVALLFWPAPRPVLLYAWLALAGLTGLGWGIIAWGSGRVRLETGLRREARLASLAGVVWAMLPGLFGAGLAPHALMGLTSVLLSLITAMALALAAVPLAMLGFVMSAGLGLVIMLAGHGLALPALATFLLILVLASTGLENGRGLVLHQIAEAGLADKRDMVSLLLREDDASGGDWIWQTDAGRCLVGVSPRLAQVLGAAPAEIEGRPILQVLAGPGWDRGDASPSLQDFADKLLQRERFVGHMLPVEIAGETRWWQLSATPRLDGQGRFLGFRGVGSDVTEAHRSVDRISRMARFDPLTSLPNRAHLMEALDLALTAAAARRGRCALLLVDLDRFKLVNDSFGHPMGDKLLTQAADRLRSLASGAGLCGRLGGDEFAIVVHEADSPAQIADLGARIIAGLSAPYEIDQTRLVIGACIGSATSPRDGRTMDSLVRAADLALYQSKREGGGRATAYQPRFEADAEERRLLEIALHGALERQELALSYQPVWDTTHNGLCGFEALLRWQRPGCAALTTDQFLPLARETRLIVPIGGWALRAACQQAAGWPRPLPIAVNIAGEQLADPGFLASVMQALSQSGLEPQRLTIDVSEEALRVAGPGGVQVLAQVQRLGIGLELGEFGIGPSALSHLSEARFAGVKLHPALVHDAARQDRESIARLRAITTLARSLGVTANAVGIETDAQLQMARALGASHVQGFLLGPPLPEAELPALMANPAMARAVA
ncbi:MAG: putative bifunctional diguanylate cyclase/phosphodiesterase [Chakrabartia sp.]